MKRLPLPTKQSSLHHNVLVLFVFVQCHEVIAHMMQPPGFSLIRPPSCPDSSHPFHRRRSSSCLSRGYFSNHSLTGREERDRSNNTDMHVILWLCFCRPTNSQLEIYVFLKQGVWELFVSVGWPHDESVPPLPWELRQAPAFLRPWMQHWKS